MLLMGPITVVPSCIVAIGSFRSHFGELHIRPQHTHGINSIKRRSWPLKGHARVFLFFFFTFFHYYPALLYLL